MSSSDGFCSKSVMQAEYFEPRQQLLLRKLREGQLSHEEYQILSEKDREAADLDRQNTCASSLQQICHGKDNVHHPDDIDLDASLDRSLSHLYSNCVKKGVGIDDFECIRILGKGGFGKVLLVKKKDSGEWYAMKTLIKAQLKRRNVVNQTKAERFILQNIQHPLVVPLCFAFQTKSKLYLLTPFYSGGDLHHYLKQRREQARLKQKEAHMQGGVQGETVSDPAGRQQWGLHEGQVRLYAAELLLALEHLHENGIIYRDLKGHIHLTDFGLSKAFAAPCFLNQKVSYGSGARGGTNQKTTTMVGTPGYTAPEILLGIQYDRLVDYWSFGVLVYFMIVGVLPFHHQNLQALAEMVVCAPISWPDCSRGANSLMQGLLQRQPSIRQFFVDSIKEHAFWVELDPSCKMNREGYPQRQKLDWAKVFAKQYVPLYIPPAPISLDHLNVDKEHVADDEDSLTQMLGQSIDVSGSGRHTFSGFSYDGRSISGASSGKDQVGRAIKLLHQRYAAEPELSAVESQDRESMDVATMHPPAPIKIQTQEDIAGEHRQGQQRLHHGGTPGLQWVPPTDEAEEDDEDDGGRIPSNFDIAALGLDMDMSGMSIDDESEY